MSTPLPLVGIGPPRPSAPQPQRLPQPGDPIVPGRPDGRLDYNTISQRTPDLPDRVPPQSTWTPAVREAVEAFLSARADYLDLAADMEYRGLFDDPAEELARRVRRDPTTTATVDSIVRERVEAMAELERLRTAVMAARRGVVDAVRQDRGVCLARATAALAPAQERWRNAYAELEAATAALRRVGEEWRRTAYVAANQPDLPGYLQVGTAMNPVRAALETVRPDRVLRDFSQRVRSIAATLGLDLDDQDDQDADDQDAAPIVITAADVAAVAHDTAAPDQPDGTPTAA